MSEVKKFLDIEGGKALWNLDAIDSDSLMTVYVVKMKLCIFGGRTNGTISW